MKKSKVLIFTIAVVVMIIAIIAIILFSIKNMPIKYLNEKYGFEKSKIECIHFRPKYYFYDLDYFEYGWTTPTWIFRYNDNEFIVKKTKFGYRDDYQFSEYYDWCLNYVDSNTYEKIDSIFMDSKELFNSDSLLAEKDFHNLLLKESSLTVFISSADIEKAVSIGDSLTKEIKELGIEDGANSYIVIDFKSQKKIIEMDSEDREYVSKMSYDKSIRELIKEQKIFYTNQDK